MKPLEKVMNSFYFTPIALLTKNLYKLLKHKTQLNQDKRNRSKMMRISPIFISPTRLKLYSKGDENNEKIRINFITNY